MPRVVDQEERRREITYAVWYLLATRGPDAVSLRSVAAEAGVSVGRIQHYFASREALLRHGCVAMVELAAEVFSGGGPDGADGADGAEGRDGADGPGVDPLGELRRLVVQPVPVTPHARTGVAVWFAYLALSAGDPEIAVVLAGARRGQERAAAELLQRAIDARQARRHLDVVPTVRRLLATADGLMVRVLVGDLGPAEALEMLEGDLEALRRRRRGS